MRIASAHCSPADKAIAAITHLSLLGGNEAAFYFLLRSMPPEELTAVLDMLAVKDTTFHELADRVYHHDWLPEVMPRLQLLDDPHLKLELASRFSRLESLIAGHMDPLYVEALPAA